MPPRTRLAGLSLLLGAVLLTGCRSGTALKGGSDPERAGVASGEEAEDYSQGAVERRTEGHARYAAAVLLDLDGERKLAAEEFFKAAMADSANEELVMEVSRRLLHERMNEQALELLLEATARPEASGTLHARLGLIEALLGHKEAAVAANRAAILKMPQSLDGYRHLAQLFFQDGRTEEGLKILDEAAAQTEVDAGFLIELGELYLGFGRAASVPSDQIRPRALAVLNRVEAGKLENLVWLQKLAEGYGALGEGEKMVDAYVRLLERLPDLPGVREKLTELYLRKQDRGRATEMLEQIIKKNPTHSQAYFFLGVLAFEQQQPKQAAEHFQKAILLDPDMEQAYYDLAGAQLSLDQPQAALATLDKAKERHARGFVGEYLCGLACNRMKNYSNALGHFTAAEVIARATETNRLTPVFYFQLGAIHERCQRYAEAEKYFRQCLDMAPDFSEALNYLGYMWAERGVNLAEAHAMIRKAVELEPDNAAFLDSLGWVLFKMGQTEEALARILRAIELNKEPDATLHDHLGDIYQKLNQTEKARDAWRKSLQVESTEAVRRKLQETAPAGGQTP